MSENSKPAIGNTYQFPKKKYISKCLVWVAEELPTATTKLKGE